MGWAGGGGNGLCPEWVSSYKGGCYVAMLWSSGAQKGTDAKDTSTLAPKSSEVGVLRLHLGSRVRQNASPLTLPVSEVVMEALGRAKASPIPTPPLPPTPPPRTGCKAASHAELEDGRLNWPGARGVCTSWDPASARQLEQGTPGLGVAQLLGQRISQGDSCHM